MNAAFQLLNYTFVVMFFYLIMRLTHLIFTLSLYDYEAYIHTTQIYCYELNDVMKQMLEQKL